MKNIWKLVVILLLLIVACVPQKKIYITLQDEGIRRINETHGIIESPCFFGADDTIEITPTVIENCCILDDMNTLKVHQCHFRSPTWKGEIG